MLLIINPIIEKKRIKNSLLNIMLFLDLKKKQKKMGENSKQQTNGTQARRLSFIEDQSINSTDVNIKKSHLVPTNVQPSAPVNTPDNRVGKPKWNAPRQSVFNRRFSHSMSFSSRKSSQDLPLATRSRYQNTYRLNPDEQSKFYAYKVEPKIYATLEHGLKGRTYEPAKCSLLAKELSEDIMRETRNCLVHSSRYKLVAHVSIGQLLDQDVRSASRCLWDANFDNYVNVCYKTNDIFAVATLFAVYFE
jgi:hypothetical protein